MGVLEAMTATVELAYRRKMPDGPGPLNYPHIAGMLIQMKEQNFDEAKMNRWLGWAQCAVVAAGIATIDEMRAINTIHLKG